MVAVPSIVFAIALLLLFGTVVLVGIDHVPTLLVTYWPTLALGATFGMAVTTFFWAITSGVFVSQANRRANDKLQEEREEFSKDKRFVETAYEKARSLHEEAMTARQTAHDALASAKAMRAQGQALIDDAERRRINATAVAERRKRKLARLQASA